MNPVEPKAAMTLATLLAGSAVVPARLDVTVSGLGIDSRKLRAGDLFLACAGSRQHGLRYADQARLAGARAILWEPPAPAGIDCGQDDMLAVPELSERVGTLAARFYDRPSRDLRVAGVTGTDGKTSCAHFLAQALSKSGHPCGLLGTLGYGTIDDLDEAVHTTPDAVNLQRLLDKLRRQGIHDVAMEVSSHALDQGRIAATHIRFAIFTNLSRDHLDYHGDLRRYADAKALLFQRRGLEAAIINVDDPFGCELKASLPADEVVAYGLGDVRRAAGKSRYVMGLDLSMERRGCSLEISSSWGRARVRTALLGRFNALNTLAVMATLLAMGKPFGECVAAVSRLQPVPGRMERLGGEGRPLVVVDYAHTPNALDQVLAALREQSDGRLLCVFGCGGDRDSGKRPQMARVVQRWADRIVVTDDNPRHEDPERIVGDILAGFSADVVVTVERDRARAIRLAVDAADSADTVLVAGKGHENYQLIGDRRLTFSDRNAVLDALGLAA